MKSCVDDLAQNGHLIRIEQEIDPYLETAEIQRRVYAAGGPAIYFSRLKGCKFPAVSNLFGTMDRTRFIFRKTLAAVKKLIEFKIDPMAPFKQPFTAIRHLPTALSMLPKGVSRGPVMSHSCQISDLPQITSWPQDGGPFITLPEVYTESPLKPGLMKSNLGMYRVQLAGNSYRPDLQVGMHYQIHRSIGVHHREAIERKQPLKVNVFVGGSPAMILSAVMPLPEGMSELMFGGALAGHRIPMIQRPHEIAMYAEADFCITGEIDPELQLPEGPFGDHLGYYSLTHDFPVLNVQKVWHRPGAIWPFTTVGRPPQEDTAFGEIIHEITGPIIPTVIPGVKAIHAVDAAGVHPLLLAIGSERYVPYAKERTPQELLTQSNAILGQGQLSLAKYLMIVAHEDEPNLDIHDIPRYLKHLLERVDWKRDLHFETCTTIDTLDYSGSGFNQGSKVVIAAAGPLKRHLPQELPAFGQLPPGFDDVQLILPGIIAIKAPAYQAERATADPVLQQFSASLPADHPLMQFPLWVMVDDAKFCAETLNNFLWVAMTRSNPAHDLYGVGEFITHKHWGCTGSLIIDARLKPWHAPPLIEDSKITAKVNILATKGGPLHGII